MSANHWNLIMVCKASFYHARCLHISGFQPSLESIAAQNSLKKVLAPSKHTAIPCPTAPILAMYMYLPKVSRQCSPSPPWWRWFFSINHLWCMVHSLHWLPDQKELQHCPPSVPHRFHWSDFTSQPHHGYHGCHEIYYPEYCRLATPAISTYGPWN